MNASTAETNTTNRARPRVPVTLSALVQRLRRHHARNAERFCVTRSERWLRDFGWWYVVDSTNYLAYKFCDQEALIEHAREGGVLAAHEEVAS